VAVYLLLAIIIIPYAAKDLPEATKILKKNKRQNIEYSGANTF